MPCGESKIKRTSVHPSNPINKSSKGRSSENSSEAIEANPEMLKTGVSITAAVSAFLIYRFQ